MFAGIKLVVFDLDGTLVDAFEDITVAANYIRGVNGLEPLPVSEVKKHVGNGARVLVSGVLGVSDPEIVEKNHDLLVRYYNENPGTKTSLYPLAIETLTELKRRGIRNAVASNKPDPVTQQVVTLMGIRHLIPDAIGETPGIPRKPAPHMLQHLMQRASVTPAETLMVGDTDVDINFARAAGVAIVSVTYGQYDRDYLEALKPDAIISSLNELPSLIASA